MKNYLRISARYIWQNRLYAIINIVALSTALTCTVLAILFWQDESGFDTFHKNNPNLYRIYSNITGKDGKVITTGGTGQVQGPAFKAAIPEVKSYVRILGGDIKSDVAAGNKTLKLTPLFVDKNFFDVFTFQVLRGNPSAALNDIGSIVLTESTAMKFFNSTDVVGRTMSMSGDPSFEKFGKPLIVSAVVQDPPANSSLQFDALFTFEFMRLSFEDNNWLNTYLGTFVVLNPGSNIRSVIQKFNDIYKFHAKEQLGDNRYDIYGFDPKITYGLQPVTDIHLNPLAESEFAEGGIINGSSVVYSYVFLGIAFFVLLMATINFVNISIAGSLKRAKEVCIKKIAGSSRVQIIKQFMIESALLCCMALIMALCFVSLLLPLFNELTGKHILFENALDGKLFFLLIGLLVTVTLLTGSYPALILSNFKPAEILYNRQKFLNKNFLSKTLVVVQFSLAVILLIASVVYNNQMNYIRTKDLGYKPSEIIKIGVSGDRDYKTLTTYLKSELIKETSIKSVSYVNDGYFNNVQVVNKVFKASHKTIDENFLKTLEIPLISGRNFSSFDKNNVLVNQAFVKDMGIKDPIGKAVNMDPGGNNSEKVIIGVIKDFHFSSLREPIKPMVMYMNDNYDGSLLVKLDHSRQQQGIAAAERIYRSAMPDAAFQYNFLDDLNARQYFQEQRWQKIINIATLLSFTVCCLGLFALAHLSTARRVKEIGIRKVLGASVSQIISTLSLNFLKLVMIAFVVAAPVAWMIMNWWLQDFAYRISITWWMVAMAGLIAIGVALITISFQSIKAAMANPVESLRTE
jgi:putative ABC transport system permease protein